MTEKITFELYLLSDYWNKPPYIKVTVDDISYFNGPIVDKSHVIKFTHTCEFNKSHRLTIIRSGKDDSQCIIDTNGTKKDQILILDKVKIDGIDIRNIILSQSVNIADYPEPWASEQRAAGNILETEAIGVTTFGHNGTWYLDFTSPFFIFIMRWMGGGPI